MTGTITRHGVHRARLVSIAPSQLLHATKLETSRHCADFAAAVFDSCGMAGGHRPPDGGFGGIYVNTSHAKLGDAGSEVLPKAPSNTTWSAGKSYEVTWTIEANRKQANLATIALSHTGALPGIPHSGHVS